MITLNRSYQISKPVFYNGTYNYTWESSSNCVTISPSSGVTTGIVNAQFTFLNEACLENSSFTLHVIDQNGCRESVMINIPNVCETLELNQISEQPNYILSVSASSPQCSGITFQWFVDNSLFDFNQTFNSSFSSSIQLIFKNRVNDLPSNTSIRVVATDCYGCVKETTYLLTICKPALQTVIANLYCNESLYSSPNIFIPAPTTCPNFTPDWSTLSFINTNNFNITRVLNQPVSNYITVSTNNLSVTPGFYSAFYNVRDTNGVLSQNGTINIIVHSCNTSPISIPDFTYQIDCSVEVGDYVDIPIDNRIFVLNTSTVDWLTWQLVIPPTPLSNDITLFTNVQGSHFIRYQVPVVSGSDAFRWTVCDTVGNCATAGTYTIILDCSTPPQLTADSTCAACGASTIISVLDNDLPGGSPFNLSTLSITTNPQHGTAIALSNGTILYQSNANYDGPDSFAYTIANVSGSVATPVSVVIDVVCAGNGGTVTVCNE